MFRQSPAALKTTRWSRIRFLYSTCQVLELPDWRAVSTLVLHGISLAICGIFLTFALRAWRSKQPVYEPSRHQSLDTSFSAASDSPGSSTPQLSPVSARKLSVQSSSTSPPSSALSTFLTSRRSRLCSTRSVLMSVQGLALAAWAASTIEQVGRLALYLTQLFQCSQYDCWLSAPAVNEQCPTLYPAFLVVLLAQPVGLCLFVLASMLPFLRVYSVLSRFRHNALVAASLTAILVTIARLLSVAMHQLLPFWLAQGDDPAVQDGIATSPIFPNAPLIKAVLFAFEWTLTVSIVLYTLCALLSIALALHFVVQVRSQVKTLTLAPTLDCVSAEQADFSKAQHHDSGQQIHARTIYLLLCAIMVCLVCLFGALTFRLVIRVFGSQQMATAVLSFGLRVIMAMVSVAMARVCKLVNVQ